MGLFSQADTVDLLEDLLDRERAAVLEGRFDVLERLGSEKERLVRTVQRDGASVRALERLRRETLRNGALLEAMRAGVSAAQNRLKSMQTAGQKLETYDAKGQKSVINLAQGLAGRRA